MRIYRNLHRTCLILCRERYRDLLQASTSIIEISQLSQNAQHLVSQMERTTSFQGVNKLVNGTVAKISSDGVVDEFHNLTGHSNVSAEDQLQALQCLAAHVKLLIDASEHLWRFLERRRYLHATWLFLLCRVVYRSLVRVDEDNIKSWMNQGINVMVRHT